MIAATDLDSTLDSALFRRFNEVLKVPLPGIEEISQLLKVTLVAHGDGNSHQMAGNRTGDGWYVGIGSRSYRAERREALCTGKQAER